MIWHYHNAAGLLLVAGAPYSASFVPFFRSSSHPRAVPQRIRFSVGEVGLRVPLSTTTPLPLPLLTPTVLPPSPRRPGHPPPPPELWGSIHEEACKGSADATRLSTFFERGPSSSRWTSVGMMAVANFLTRTIFFILTSYPFTWLNTYNTYT